MKLFAVLAIISTFALCNAQDEVPPQPPVAEVEDASVPEVPTTTPVVEEFVPTTVADSVPSVNEEQEPIAEQDPAPVPEETHEDDSTTEVETTSAANTVSQGPNAEVPKENKCPNGRLEGDTNDCSAYYICLKPSGRKIKLYCAHYFYFDLESKTCKPKGSLKC